MYSATGGAVAAIQSLIGYETVGLSLAGLACRRPPRVLVGLVASATPLQLGGTGVVSPLEYPRLLRTVFPKDLDSCYLGGGSQKECCVLQSQSVVNNILTVVGSVERVVATRAA